MLKAFVEKINELKDPEMITIEDYVFRKNGYHMFTPPLAEKITIHTLQGFVDFIPTFQEEKDDLMIVVESPERVLLIGRLDEKYKTRNIYCAASLNRESVPIDRWRDPESFNIFLQTNFCLTDDKGRILELVGNMTDEAVNNYSDDGVSQTITAKKGISRKENANVPNPVTLAPYRTFIDVDQPESTFIFRIKSERGPECCLFPADGELWKVKAIKNIKKFLSDKVGDIPVIG